MKALLVEIELAWGFSVKRPFFAKEQPALPIPPPTTLIGALAYPIARLREQGEVEYKDEKFHSTASRYSSLFKAVTAFIDRGHYWEDISRYQILYFQKPVRRMKPEYRYGVIPTGKVYAPGAIINVAYLINEEKAENIIGDDWHKTILCASYSITRIGSRESVISVRKAWLIDVGSTRGEFCTRYYQPIDHIDLSKGVKSCDGYEADYYIERFWDGGYVWGDSGDYKEYIIPGSRTPIRSSRIKLHARPGYEVYLVGEDGIVT